MQEKSLLLEVLLQFHGHVEVGSESGVTGLFLESWVPVVELIPAVTEAKAFVVSQVPNISLLTALSEALVVQVFEKSVILSNVCMEVILNLQRVRFKLLKCK